MQRRFLNHPVSTGVGSPNAEAKFNFGGWGIIAFPPSPELEASLHIDLAAHQLSLADGMSVLNQLLSIAAWLDDNYVVLLPGLSGSSEPNRQPRQTREFPTSMVAGWSNSWEPMMDGRARLTLAIYREAVNMQSYHFLPFAVVGFYRVLEVAWPDGKERSSRIEEPAPRGS
jgi:hypothetical protein